MSYEQLAKLEFGLNGEDNTCNKLLNKILIKLIVSNMELLRPCKIRMMIICVVFSQCLMSCLYDEMYNFSDKDLKWMPPYELDDTILFCSDCDVDTMVVVKRYIENSRSPFMRNEGFSIYQAIGCVDGIISHHGIPLDFSFFIQKTDNLILNVNYRFADRSCTFVSCHPDVYLNGGYKRVKFYKTEIEGKLYNDLVIVREKNSNLYCNFRSTYNCEYFYWSKSKGLLKYKYMDTDSTKGEVYTYYKRLPRNRKGFWSL